MPKFWPRAFSGVGGSFYAGFVGVILVLVAPQALAYNDENPMLKWSPNYLFGSGPDGLGSRVTKSAYAYDNTFSPRFARFDRFYGLPRGVGQVEGSLGSRNPGFYSRPVRAGDKRSACVADGETCLYRSGLAGAVIKLPCCQGSVCAYKGYSFNCMAKDDLIAENREDTTDYSDLEGLY